GHAYSPSSSAWSSQNAATERRNSLNGRGKAARTRGWCHAGGLPRQSPPTGGERPPPPGGGPPGGAPPRQSPRAGREEPLVLLDGSGDEAPGGLLEGRVFPRFPCTQGAPALVGRRELTP